MNKKILTITEKVITPDMGGNSYVVPDYDSKKCIILKCADNHYKILSPYITYTPSGPHKGYHKTIAKLWRESPGRYFAEIDENHLDLFDPESSGKTEEEFKISFEAVSKPWSCKDEIDETTLCIPSLFGLNDSRPAKRYLPISGSIIKKDKKK